MIPTVWSDITPMRGKAQAEFKMEREQADETEWQGIPQLMEAVCRPQPPTRLSFAILDLRSWRLTSAWILTITGRIAVDFSQNEKIKFALAGAVEFLVLFLCLALKRHALGCEYR
jgi:hypothetical protein